VLQLPRRAITLQIVAGNTVGVVAEMVWGIVRQHGVDGVKQPDQGQSNHDEIAKERYLRPLILRDFCIRRPSSGGTSGQLIVPARNSAIARPTRIKTRKPDEQFAVVVDA
jgi:hypothetical protein